MNIEIEIFWGSLFEPLVLVRLPTFKENFKISMKHYENINYYIFKTQCTSNNINKQIKWKILFKILCFHWSQNFQIMLSSCCFQLFQFYFIDIPNDIFTMLIKFLIIFFHWWLKYWKNFIDVYYCAYNDIFVKIPMVSSYVFHDYGKIWKKILNGPIYRIISNKSWLLEKPSIKYFYWFHGRRISEKPFIK
jgi:hypothetical protein